VQLLRIPSTATNSRNHWGSHPWAVAAIAAIGNGLEEADQVGISTEINGRASGLGHREGVRPASKPGTCAAAKGALDRLSGALAMTHSICISACLPVVNLEI
jgi:hypothetical protein